MVNDSDFSALRSFSQGNPGLFAGPGRAELIIAAIRNVDNTRTHQLSAIGDGILKHITGQQERHLVEQALKVSSLLTMRKIIF